MKGLTPYLSIFLDSFVRKELFEIISTKKNENSGPYSLSEAYLGEIISKIIYEIIY